jgi:hypothetical protein
VPVLQAVPGGDRLPDAAHLLVGHGSALAQHAAGRVEEQVALVVHLHPVDAAEGDPHDRGVGARRHHHVVFELAGRPVEDDVHPGIDLRVADTLEGRHAGAPPGGVGAQEVADVAGERVLGGDRRGGVAAGEAHLEDRGHGPPRHPDDHHVGLEQELKARRPGQEAHVGVAGLASVGLEGDGQPGPARGELTDARRIGHREGRAGRRVDGGAQDGTHEGQQASGHMSPRTAP